MKFLNKIFLLLLSLSFLSCSLTSEGKYRDILEEYAEGKLIDTSLITETILERFASTSINGENLFLSKNTIVKGNENDISIVFPETVNLNVDKIISDNISFADISENRILLGNRKGFCAFNRGGDPVTVYRADKKEVIDAASLRGDNTVFLSDGRILELSDSEKKVTRLDPGEYDPPYRKFFRSSIVSSDKYIGLITGIAGSYYISIFDSESGQARVKNIAASSFEFNLKDDYLLYIRGGTANWTVIKYDIPVKKRNELKTLGKIGDVYLAEDGFFYINEKRAFIENLKGEKWETPPELNVKGICRNSVLALYNGKIYIIDFNVLFEKVKEFGQAKASKDV